MQHHPPRLTALAAGLLALGAISHLPAGGEEADNSTAIRFEKSQLDATFRSEGAAVAAFFAYSEAKRRSKTPEKFGTGHEEGIVAPETANNATVGGALVPTLTLGVPGSPAAAVLLGAFLIHGLAPGPKLFAERPDMMYAIFIGLFVINILMMVIGLMAIRFAAKLIQVPTTFIVPTVLLLSFVGIFSVSNSFFNVGVLLGAGILGYVVRKLGYSIAPLSIGFVLGPILENSLRQSLVIADGSVGEFLNTPIGLGIYAALALTIFGGPLAAWVKSKMFTRAEDA